MEVEITFVIKYIGLPPIPVRKEKQEQPCLLAIHRLLPSIRCRQSRRGSCPLGLLGMHMITGLTPAYGTRSVVVLMTTDKIPDPTLSTGFALLLLDLGHTAVLP